MMTFRQFPYAKNVRVIVSERALEAVFDECDQFDVDETGGRIIGTFVDHGGILTINVAGIIESGPKARRTNTSFFQDGDYQEAVFRKLEREHPSIEHLGNWHTHHVNGFPHLSGGDVQTYQRTVNHAQHNTSFFYAMLVTAREGARSKHRYRVKHYVLRRGDARVYEIDGRHVQIVDRPILWPTADATGEALAAPTTTPIAGESAPSASSIAMQRAYDGAVLRDLYAKIRAFKSPSVGLHWRGPIELSDGSDAQVLVTEEAVNGGLSYSIGLANPSAHLASVASTLEERQFPSARAALIHAERACNRALFHGANNSRSSVN